MKSHEERHWQTVYSTKDPAEVSWHQSIPRPSLKALEQIGASSAQSLVDVGGGASTLVDELLDRGWRDLAVLDISGAALKGAQTRLGQRATDVNWIAADIRNWSPQRQWDIWHDRAVFHFLVEADDRKRYKEKLLQGLAQDGALIMATFALSGPERCSGLPVRRYDASSLAAEMGPDLQFVEGWTDDHLAPWGSIQTFTWAIFRRVS